MYVTVLLQTTESTQFSLNRKVFLKKVIRWNIESQVRQRTRLGCYLASIKAARRPDQPHHWVLVAKHHCYSNTVLSTSDARFQKLKLCHNVPEESNVCHQAFPQAELSPHKAHFPVTIAHRVCAWLNLGCMKNPSCRQTRKGWHECGAAGQRFLQSL